MNAPLSSPIRFDIQGLASAIAHSHASDALHGQFPAPHWDILASYLQPFSVQAGQLLFEKGGHDRTLYFVESGTLTVHYEDDKARVRMALVGAGTVLGEGAFFSHLPRHATANASTPCKLWCLTSLRFLELAHRHSAVALELTTAVAGVMARRLYNRPKRVAVA